MTPSRSRTPLVIGAVVALVAVAAVVAVVAVGGDDDDGGTATTAAEGSSPVPSAGTLAPGAGSPISAADGEPDFAAVQVSGSPLPAMTPADQEAGTDPALGAPAPGLTGSDYDGAVSAIEPGVDGPLMLVFLAHWCPHCNAEVPRLLEWRDAGEVPEELSVVGVSTAVSAERPNYPPGPWLRDNGWEWPVLGDDADLTAARAYGVSGFPFIVVVGGDGTVLARHSGELSVDEIDTFVDGALTA